MFVRRPIWMKFASPRKTQWNQTPESAPIRTSPMIAAVGAIHADGSIAGSASPRRKTEEFRLLAALSRVRCIGRLLQVIAFVNDLPLAFAESEVEEILPIHGASSHHEAEGYAHTRQIGRA